MDKSLRPVARPRSKTGEMTSANRPVWKDEQTGESYSERTVTVPYGDGFVVMPSVGRDGATYTEEQIYEYVKKNGPVDFMTGEKLPIFEDIETAGKYARARSGSLMDADQPMPEFKSRRPEMMEKEAGTSMMDVGKAVAKLGLAGAQLAGKKLGMDINPTADNPLGFSEGGNVSMQKQMSMFEDGGLLDEGGMVDEVSGNDVPIGSTRKEVRDDIPARLSEGEFVFPADVVRYYGLEKLMELRQNAKMGLKRMEEMGQMGNSDEATLPDDLPFGMEDLVIIAEPQEFAEGGMPQTNPLPIAPVPTRGPNTSLLSGMTGGMRMVTYVNAEGNTMVIPHVNGVPIYPIPDGYRVLAEGESPTGSDTTPTQDTTTQQPVQTTPREEFDGGPDPEPSDFDITEVSDEDLDAMIAAPGKLGNKAIGAAVSILGTPIMGAFFRGAMNANKSRAEQEKARRAINEDVQKTIDKLAQEEETPVKGAPVSDITETNIDDKETSQPVDTPAPAPTGISQTGMSGLEGIMADVETQDFVGPQTEAALDVALANPSLDEGIFGQPGMGQLSGGRDVSPAVAQAVANQAAISRSGWVDSIDEGIVGLGETSPSATPSTPSLGPTSSAASAMNQGYSALGEFYGAPVSPEANNPYSGLANSVGYSSNTSPSRGFDYSGNTPSSAESAASLGFGSDPGGEFGLGPSGPSAGQVAAEAAMGLDPFGGEGPDVSGPTGGGNNDGPSAPSGGSSGGTGGGGADSGQAAAAADAAAAAADAQANSGPFNKGGLATRKQKSKKRKPNTSRGIAARKK